MFPGTGPGYAYQLAASAHLVGVHLCAFALTRNVWSGKPVKDFARSTFHTLELSVGAQTRTGTLSSSDQISAPLY